jgi:hypothetical protein
MFNDTFQGIGVAVRKSHVCPVPCCRWEGMCYSKKRDGGNAITEMGLPLSHVSPD